MSEFLNTDAEIIDVMKDFDMRRPKMADAILTQRKLLACIAIYSETPEGDEFLGDVLSQPLRNMLEEYINHYDKDWVATVQPGPGNAQGHDVNE